MAINTVILAAGKGTRMHSSKPKVLQNLSDKTLLEHVLSQTKALSDNVHIVVGFGAEEVQNSIIDKDINWVEQKQQLGTGHAVSQAIEFIDDNSTTLVLYGDVPLIKQKTLKNLLAKSSKTGIALLSVVLDNPNGYGRIVRQDGNINAIIEQKDANQEQLKISEVNTGIMALDSALLKKYLQQINNNNAQGELYLTDIIAIAVKDGKQISSVITDDKFEVAGVNDKAQLYELERVFQLKQAYKFMQQGLTIKDANRFDCRGSLEFGKDCEVDVNTIFIGNVILGDNVQILPNCVIENATINNDTTIGPFARIRPQTNIGKGAKIGNFVEVKKSNIGDNSKVSHLSYIGDATIGKKVNIGAGVITCNYDGVNKHKSIIEDGAFIGSDTQLVAPIKIGKNATIGAGSTITKNTEENMLTLSRSKQLALKNWKKPVKN